MSLVHGHFRRGQVQIMQCEQHVTERLLEFLVRCVTLAVEWKDVIVPV